MPEDITSPSPDPAVVLAWARLVKVSQGALAAVEQDLKKAGFPPLSWYDVLLELWRADGERLRPYELEKRLLLRQYTLSRLLDRLEREALIIRSRCREDRRGQRVRITKEGLALLERMWPAYAEAIQTHIGNRLSHDEAGVLAELLSRLTGEKAEFRPGNHMLDA